MTSFGVTKEVVHDGFMPTFKNEGQVYHSIGSVYPNNNDQTKFLQIYFMGSEEQCDRRDIFEDLDKPIILALQNMLHTPIKTANECHPTNTSNLIT